MKFAHVMLSSRDSVNEPPSLPVLLLIQCIVQQVNTKITAFIFCNKLPDFKLFMQNLILRPLSCPKFWCSLSLFGSVGIVQRLSASVNNMSETLSPKESGKFITENGKYVKVLQSGADKCAAEIFEAVRTEKLSPRNFSQSGLHPSPSDPKAADWIFLVDTLNFSFWSGVSLDGESGEEPKWEVSYKGKTHTGYFALCAGVNRAIEEGLDLTSPKVYGSLSEDDIRRIFRSETSAPIPLVEDRVKSLKEASQVLVAKYEGSFVNCLKACNKNAQQLLKLVVSEFPSYKDEADFEGKRVSLYKRAQILIGDVWACHEGKGLGQFDDIETLTMFADYRVPQVLLHYGALEYSPELWQMLEKNNTLTNGDRREVEIRGASIHAVELIKDSVRKHLTEAGLPLTSINSVMIDHFLWDYRREHATAMDKYPYHKTRCIYY